MRVIRKTKPQTKSVTLMGVTAGTVFTTELSPSSPLLMRLDKSAPFDVPSTDPADGKWLATVNLETGAIVLFREGMQVYKVRSEFIHLGWVGPSLPG